MASPARSDPKAVVKEWVEAVNKHDVEAIAACFAADYHDVEPAHPTRQITGGRENVRKNYGMVLQGMRDLRLEILRLAADGDTTWSEVDWLARGAMAAESICEVCTSSGSAMGRSLGAASIWSRWKKMASTSTNGSDACPRGPRQKPRHLAEQSKGRCIGMAKTKASTGGLVRVNGADIYHEIRGTGPSVLLIHGGGGDAGYWGRLPDNLSRDFMVVSYDRRGLSRSPRPSAWTQTSIAEQAEDAAALLKALDVAPASLVGASLGALIALELLLQHPDLVRRASLLDPGPLDSAIPDRRERMVLPEPVRAAMARGDSEAAFEALMRDSDLWDALDPATRERILGNAELFFTHETPLLQSYRPDGALLRANRVPVQVGVGQDTPPLFREMAEWLASRLRVRVETYPGGHAATSTHPEEVVKVIRSFLQVHAENAARSAERLPRIKRS